jgi:hypothetical protein
LADISPLNYNKKSKKGSKYMAGKAGRLRLGQEQELGQEDKVLELPK